mmetsp:Transcript_88958/g.247135  ORF Transcript_88958/g.247135 Transcript_88958/m.247135 type:complete len:325 (+) Transcript_88958:512-1486(+)
MMLVSPFFLERAVFASPRASLSPTALLTCNVLGLGEVLGPIACTMPWCFFPVMLHCPSLYPSMMYAGSVGFRISTCGWPQRLPPCPAPSSNGAATSGACGRGAVASSTPALPPRPLARAEVRGNGAAAGASTSAARADKGGASNFDHGRGRASIRSTTMGTCRFESPPPSSTQHLACASSAPSRTNTTMRAMALLKGPARQAAPMAVAQGFACSQSVKSRAHGAVPRPQECSPSQRAKNMGLAKLRPPWLGASSPPACSAYIRCSGQWMGTKGISCWTACHVPKSAGTDQGAEADGHPPCAATHGSGQQLHCSMVNAVTVCTAM